MLRILLAWMRAHSPSCVKEMLCRSTHAGLTPFLVACSKGHVHIIKWLLGLPDWDGVARTSGAATVNDNTSRAEQLLSQTDLDGNSGFMLACRKGQLNTAVTLYAQKPELLHMAGQHGELPCAAAVSFTCCDNNDDRVNLY